MQGHSCRSCTCCRFLAQTPAKLDDETVIFQEDVGEFARLDAHLASEPGEAVGPLDERMESLFEVAVDPVGDVAQHLGDHGALSQVGSAFSLCQEPRSRGPTGGDRVGEEPEGGLQCGDGADVDGGLFGGGHRQRASAMPQLVGERAVPVHAGRSVVDDARGRETRASTSLHNLQVLGKDVGVAHRPRFDRGHPID